MDVAELGRQIEYKVAPEPLIAVQGLANTFAYDVGEERLADPGAARDWLVESGLAQPGIRVSQSDLELLLELRRRVRDLIDANLAADPAASALPAARALARIAADHPLPLAATDDGLDLDLEPVDAVSRFAGQVIGIVYEAQCRGEWPRLKICASDECRWAFFDSSRNRGGTWCQMEVCGNRVKNRTYRRRRATA